MSRSRTLKISAQSCECQTRHTACPQVDDDHGRVPLATLANTLVHADPVVDVEASLGGKCTGIAGVEHP